MLSTGSFIVKFSHRTRPMIKSTGNGRIPRLVERITGRPRPISIDVMKINLEDCERLEPGNCKTLSLDLLVLKELPTPTVFSLREGQPTVSGSVPLKTTMEIGLPRLPVDFLGRLPFINKPIGMSAVQFSTTSAAMKTFKSETVKNNKAGSAGSSNVEKRPSKKYQDDGSPQILLIEREDKIINVSLRQAERIAKRRDLKITQVEDPILKGKTNKQVFKLITGKEYYEISRAKKASKTTPTIKGEKTLSLNAKIESNDLMSKLQNMEKWLKKGFQIKVTIVSRGASDKDMESVLAEIQREVTKFGGRILQQREKFGDVKFFVAPPKRNKDQANESDQISDTSNIKETEKQNEE